MYITESNPFYITIDLNEVVTANKLTFNGYTASNVSSGNLGMPKDFILYGKVNENDEFFKIAEFKDQTYTNRQMVVSFDYSTFRYFQLYVTKTDNNKYFAMNNLKFTYEFEILGGKQIAPDNDMLKFVGTWQENHKLSTFGRIMVGQKDYTLKFMFTGTRFGILSSTDFENNFEVYVDGVKINSIALKQADSKIYASFMSDLLQNSTHNVEIKCLGQSNIDSIVIY